MLLFIFACVFEDDPLPVLSDRAVPRPQGGVMASRTVGEDDEGQQPETVETSEGATGTNGAPVVGEVAVEPRPPTAVADLHVSAHPTDPDGNFVNVTYEWAINGTKLLAENGPTLSRDFFHRGDVVTSSIIASDGQASGRASTEITIQNAAPTITTRPEFVSSIDGLQMSARDPDKDPLTWRLEGAPYGMTINPRSGEISFKGAQVDQGGAFTVSVVVEDSGGESATWQFSAEVKGGKTTEQAQLEAKVEALAEGQDKATTPVLGTRPPTFADANQAAVAPPQPSVPAPAPQQAGGQPIFQSANDNP
jgi:hypothetical protein